MGFASPAEIVAFLKALAEAEQGGQSPTCCGGSCPKSAMTPFTARFRLNSRQKSRANQGLSFWKSFLDQSATFRLSGR
jgi:hypothetical protein